VTSELFMAALAAAMKYAEERSAVVFKPTDSTGDRLFYLYRLLVHDEQLPPVPEDQVSEESLRHRLELWYRNQLASNDPLVK
jgi:uncharacterized protein DUF5062